MSLPGRAAKTELEDAIRLVYCKNYTEFQEGNPVSQGCSDDNASIVFPG